MATKKASAKKKAPSSKGGGAAKKGAAKKGAGKKGAPKAAGDFGEHTVTSDVRSSFIMGNTFGMKEVTYTARGDDALFEGDILLGSVAEMEQIKRSVEEAAETEATEGIARSVVISGAQFRWPDGIIPFRIDPALPNQQRVTDAIAHWEANTVIRFVQRTPANAGSHPNFVHFVHGGGCSSAVGGLSGVMVSRPFLEKAVRS